MTTIKHYGLITAVIDDQARSIDLRWTPRYRDPLDTNHPQRCLGWAITALAEYTDRGYVLAVPEAVTNG